MLETELVFVILHYTAMQDTIECIESIQNKVNVSYKIIVVDNASPDGSGLKLYEYYNDNEQVSVLRSSINEGFARGNNIGIAYALENYHFSFCVVLNNDTLLLEDKLYDKLKKEYEERQFAVLGPMIYTADGYADCNPVNRFVTEKYIRKSIESEKRHLMAESNLIIRIIRNVWFWTKPLIKPTVHERKDFITKQFDVMLHGSVLVFSTDYFNHFSGFYPKTFLFHEEEILHFLVMKKGLHTVYDPSIHFFHKEDASTNNVYKTSHEKRLAKFAYSVESLKVLQELYYENQ